jgi:hypothetical protein
MRNADVAAVITSGGDSSGAMDALEPHALNAEQNDGQRYQKAYS